MIPGATRSRAAILCLGGWGLQTMLHLSPRLQSAQEQRTATGVDAPDLTRITRFAALLPSDQLDHQDEIALNLFTLRDNRLPPFYLERLLTGLMRSPPPAVPESPQTTSHWRRATSQRRASLLLAEAGDALRPLQWQSTRFSKNEPGAAGAAAATARPSRMGLPWPFRRSNKDDVAGSEVSSPSSPAASSEPPTRRHAFRAALRDGGSIAHLVASNIIDPIRADTLVPGDPFVQTTLYVIAPLYEPLTSALILAGDRAPAQLSGPAPHRPGRRHLRRRQLRHRQQPHRRRRLMLRCPGRIGSVLRPAQRQPPNRSSLPS